MNKEKFENLLNAISKVRYDRHKLVIVLGNFKTGKTEMLKQAASALNGAYLNLNLFLSEKLLAQPVSRYKDNVTYFRLIDERCEELSPNKEVIFVDNIEILFSPELGKINPIDTFIRIARERPIVIALPTYRQGSTAVYSTPGNQDYLAMPLDDFIVVDINEE